MHALFDSGGHPQSRHQQRRQAAGEPVGLLADRLVVSG